MESRFPPLPALVEALVNVSSVAHWSSSRLRDLSGRKLGFVVHYKELLHQYQRLEPQKTRAKLELTQPEGSKASGHRGQLLTFYSRRCQVDLIGKVRTN